MIVLKRVCLGGPQFENLYTEAKVSNPWHAYSSGMRKQFERPRKIKIFLLFLFLIMNNISTYILISTEKLNNRYFNRRMLILCTASVFITQKKKKVIFGTWRQDNLPP